jgi:hypothetical protein
VALARSEFPRGSARNAATSVPLEEAYEAPSSVMFVLYVGSTRPEYRKSGSEKLCELSAFTECMEARKAGLPTVELGTPTTYSQERDTSSGLADA